MKVILKVNDKPITIEHKEYEEFYKLFAQTVAEHKVTNLCFTLKKEEKVATSASASPRNNADSAVVEFETPNDFRHAMGESTDFIERLAAHYPYRVDLSNVSLRSAFPAGVLANCKNGNFSFYTLSLQAMLTNLVSSKFCYALNLAACDLEVSDAQFIRTAAAKRSNPIDINLDGNTKVTAELLKSMSSAPVSTPQYQYGSCRA